MNVSKLWLRVGTEMAAPRLAGSSVVVRRRVAFFLLSLASLLLLTGNLAPEDRASHPSFLAEALQTGRFQSAAFVAPASSCGGLPSRVLECSRRATSTDLDASRRPFVGGNWKCNGSVADVERIVNMLNKVPEEVRDVEVIVAPPSIHASYVRRALRHPFSVALQNVSAVPGYGAYTGELCSEMIKDAGFDAVLVGHSERRAGFGGQAGEEDAVVATKAKRALESGLKIIACIGETLEARNEGNTHHVLSRQLQALGRVLSPQEWKRVVVAYEPVWAIGTGKTATPDTAQQTHQEIRKWIRENVGPEVAEEIRIIYGGSVKGANAKELFARPDIDGFLVGGASLNEDFLAILDAARQKAT